MAAEQRIDIPNAALVVEFHPEQASDIGAVMRLARETSARIIAVASRIDDQRMSDLRRTFVQAKNVEFYAIGASFGRGSAIRLGLNRVRERYVAVLSLEDRIEPRDIANYVTVLVERDDVDGVLGYRSTNDTPGLADVERHWRSRAYNSLANVLLHTAVRDVQSPLKVFRTSALRDVLENLQLFDHGFDADLVSNVRRLGLRIVEMPIRSKRSSRRWPLIATGMRAALSLAVLRILDSRIGNNNFVALLGRPVVLPVKKKYSILIFCWRDPRSPKAGGGEVYLHEQARCWVAQGHDVTWVAQMFNGATPHETLDGISIVRRGHSLLVFVRAAMWYIFRSGWKFDFIIDTMNGIPFFTPLFSRKPKVCLLYHVHSKHFREELPAPLASIAIAIETKIVPYIYRRTPFVTISDSSADDIKALQITTLPLQVIHSGVSDDLRPGSKSEVPTIVFIGRLRRYKGVRKLVDAFRTVRLSVPDARLIIAGTGDDEIALREYCKELSNVTFVGRVSHVEKVRLLQEAWVFGMPSSLEGWGIVVIEAAACGTPSVAYDVGGLRDCIIDGQTGLLASSDDQFAAHLRNLLVDASFRGSMSERCLTWGSQFSWDRTAARTLEQIRRSQPWSTVFEIDRELVPDVSVGDLRATMQTRRVEHQ